ncbi:Rieske (2Fe-2S) protein [Blastopirellula marina]|uniref:Benzene 1,2-dioxygenase system ferredoxin component n=1 Tax=Blastopirellula marina DSM 3645 TaxID=314230 RepID=A4A0P0_9BACT|nr:Rieske (2Fe-2S) protein [Blastopirellula marina]EAQ77706.1 benzene 1,2-dioxygenase system ferredoxin component [Blastopirellula marina DSM 3645]
MFRPLARLDELLTEGVLFRVVGELWVGIFEVDGQVYAIDARCSHAGALLTRGQVCDGAVICPIHHWRFRICDGRYLDQNLPRHDLRTFVVQIIDDQIEVDLPEF